MPTRSQDNVVRLVDRRPRTAHPIEPATLARLYDGPKPRQKLIGLEPKAHPSRWRQIIDVLMIGLIIATIGYFAAEFARAYLAGTL